MTARAIASICCSPPDRVPASWLRRSFRRGNSSSAFSRSRWTSPFGRAPVKRGKAPSSRLSVTLMVANTRRPSGEWARPARAIRCESRPVMSLPASVTLPPFGLIMPEMARMVVVLPAPLEPIRVTSLPFGTSSEMPCRTSTLP